MPAGRLWEHEKLPRHFRDVNQVTNHSHSVTFREEKEIHDAPNTMRPTSPASPYVQALSALSIHATFLVRPCPGGGMADAEDLKYAFQFCEQLNNQQESFVSAVSCASAFVGKVGANHNQQMCMLTGRIR
jgi:hypothetical protein